MRTMRSTHTLPAGFQLAFTILLAFVPVVLTTTGPSQLSLREDHFHSPVVQHRQPPPVPPDLPVGWIYFDCYTDNPAQRTLTSWADSESGAMMIPSCVYFCNSNYLTMAGLENGRDCYCGNVTTAGSISTSNSNCDVPCVGDPNEFCGGINYLSIYWVGAPMDSDSIIVEMLEGWSLMGCYNDSNDARTLTVLLTNDWNQYTNTIESCTAACGALGYSIAGVEFGLQCWCDNIINQNRTALEYPTPCGLITCSGNNKEFCGAANLLLAYANNSNIE